MTAHIDETDGVFFNDRTAATDEEFAARIAPFGIFEPEEREAAVIEEVARAMAATDDPLEWERLSDLRRYSYRRLAAAAVAAMRENEEKGARK